MDRASGDGEVWVMALLFLLSLMFFLNGDIPATGDPCEGGYWEAGMRYVDVARWVCP